VGTAEGISVLDAANDHLTDHLNIFILPPPDELNPITDVAIDPVGRIWAGVYVDYLVTVGGVSYFANGVWDQVEPADGLAGPNVRRLAVDAEGNVWVATSTGLSKIGEINIGMAEQATSTFALYPNPASSAVELVCDELAGSLPLEVRDAEGRLVRTARLNAMRATLDVSALEAGVYSVRIGDRVRPMVVQH
jgi:ligand-binding sensor domain-containing protein